MWHRQADRLAWLILFTLLWNFFLPLTECREEISPSVEELLESIEALQTKLRLLGADAKVLEQSYRKAVDRPRPSDARDFVPSAQCKRESHAKIATFNLWNLEPPWEERVEEIAEVIISQELEVIALQEVRWAAGEPPVNQGTQLLRKLKERPDVGVWYMCYQGVQAETNGIEEGLAVLSRHLITNCTLHCTLPSLSPASASSASLGQHPLDASTMKPLETYPCKRGALHASITVKGLGMIDFVNVHLPVGDMDQCKAAMNLFLLMENLYRTPSLQVLLGDFNCYFTFEWAADLFTRAFPYGFLSAPNLNPCEPILRRHVRSATLSNLLEEVRDGMLKSNVKEGIQVVPQIEGRGENSSQYESLFEMMYEMRPSFVDVWQSVHGTLKHGGGVDAAHHDAEREMKRSRAGGEQSQHPQSTQAEEGAGPQLPSSRRQKLSSSSSSSSTRFPGLRWWSYDVQQYRPGFTFLNQNSHVQHASRPDRILLRSSFQGDVHKGRRENQSASLICDSYLIDTSLHRHGQKNAFPLSDHFGLVVVLKY